MSFIKVLTANFEVLFNESTRVGGDGATADYVHTQLTVSREMPDGFEDQKYFLITSLRKVYDSRRHNPRSKTVGTPTALERRVCGFDSDAEAIRAAIKQHDEFVLKHVVVDETA